jgi:hypothetical protein
MADQQNQTLNQTRHILPERLMRRVLEGVGDVVDRKLDERRTGQRLTTIKSSCA